MRQFLRVNIARKLDLRNKNSNTQELNYTTIPKAIEYNDITTARRIFWQGIENMDLSITDGRKYLSYVFKNAHKSKNSTTPSTLYTEGDSAYEALVKLFPDATYLKSNYIRDGLTPRGLLDKAHIVASQIQKESPNDVSLLIPYYSMLEQYDNDPVQKGIIASLISSTAKGVAPTKTPSFKKHINFLNSLKPPIDTESPKLLEHHWRIYHYKYSEKDIEKVEKEVLSNPNITSRSYLYFAYVSLYRGNPSHCLELLDFIEENNLKIQDKYTDIAKNLQKAGKQSLETGIYDYSILSGMHILVSNSPYISVSKRDRRQTDSEDKNFDSR